MFSKENVPMILGVSMFVILVIVSIIIIKMNGEDKKDEDKKDNEDNEDETIDSDTDSDPDTDSDSDPDTDPDSETDPDTDNFEYNTDDEKERSERESKMDDTLVMKFKTDSNSIKKMITKLEEIHSLMVEGICVSKSQVKSSIRSVLGMRVNVDSNCNEILEEIRGYYGFNKSTVSDRFGDPDNIELLSDSILDIAEILIPNEICKDNKLNKNMIQDYLFDIIDAICDGNTAYTRSRIGYKLNTKSSVFKKIIYKVNIINKTLIKKIVCQMDQGKFFLKEYVTEFIVSFFLNIDKNDMRNFSSCSEAASLHKEFFRNNLRKKFRKYLKKDDKQLLLTTTDRKELLDIYDEVIIHIIEMTKIILDKICVGDKPNRDQFQILIEQIVDAFCHE